MKNIKNLSIIRIIYMLVLLGLFIDIFPKVIYTDKHNCVEYSIENIYFSNSFDIDNNKFNVIGEDPFFCLNINNGNFRQIEIVFRESMEFDTPIQLFYGNEEEGFEETRSLFSILKAGEKECLFRLKSSDYDQLRFDIENSFEFEKVRVWETQVSFLKIVLWIVLFCLFELFILFVKFEKTKEIPIEYAFVGIALVLGISFSLIMPPMQIPDEYKHFNMIIEEFGAQGFDGEILKFYENIGAVRVSLRPSLKMDVRLISEYKNVKFSENCGIVSVPSILMLRHLPGGIGFFIGVLFDAPIAICLHLAELVSVIFWIILGFITLKIVPIKKELLMAVMLLPMTVQQCSSVNYDAVVLPLCFLLLAIVLDCIYGERKLNWKNCLLVFGLVFNIAIIKPPYVFIAFLIFLTPEKNRGILNYLKKIKIPVIIGLVLAFVLGIYVMRENVYIKILFAILCDFTHYISIIKNTFSTFYEFYFKSMLGVFGWLDTYSSTIFYNVITVTFLLLAIKKENCKVSCLHRICFLSTAIIMVLIIVTLMLSWTLYLDGFDTMSSFDLFLKKIKEITISLGVQGRYFIPVIPLVLLPIESKIEIEKKYLISYQGIYYILIYFWTFETLWNRYW